MLFHDGSLVPKISKRWFLISVLLYLSSLKIQCLFSCNIIEWSPHKSRAVEMNILSFSARTKQNWSGAASNTDYMGAINVHQFKTTRHCRSFRAEPRWVDMDGSGNHNQQQQCCTWWRSWLFYKFYRDHLHTRTIILQRNVLFGSRYENLRLKGKPRQCFRLNSFCMKFTPSQASSI